MRARLLETVSLNMSGLVLLLGLSVSASGAAPSCRELLGQDPQSRALERALLEQRIYFPVQFPGSEIRDSTVRFETIGGLKPRDPFVGIARIEGAYRRTGPKRMDLQWKYEIDQLTENSSAIGETRRLLRAALDLYLQRGTISPAEAERLLEIDRQIDFRHCSYVSFHEKQNQAPVAFSRIVNSAPSHALFQATHASIQRLPMEIEYPSLRLPDRLAGNQYLVEVGRLGRTDIAWGDMDVFFTEVAKHLARMYPAEFLREHGGLKPVLYIEAANPALARLYQKYGFTPVFGPAELGIPAGQPQASILRTPVVDFVSLIEKKHSGGLLIHRSYPDYLQRNKSK